VSTFRPFLLRQPRVCFRSRRLLPSYAPRNANISPNFSTLRILPVATGVWGAYFQLSTLCLCACPSGRRASVANAVPKSCRVILLRTLCRSLRSFSHSRPLFSIVCRLFSQNTGGWGTLRQPSTLPTFRPSDRLRQTWRRGRASKPASESGRYRSKVKGKMRPSAWARSKRRPYIFGAQPEIAVPHWRAKKIKGATAG
jgi:hypothetical protein